MVPADDIIAKLGLKPHPEGGYFRETFRDRSANGRALSTAILYLLKAGEISQWHRVDAVEVWHWYAGAALELSQSDGAGDRVVKILGNDFVNGQLPQLIVPAQMWQSATSLGEWTLAGCTVAPGFEFDGFEMAPKNWQP